MIQGALFVGVSLCLTQVGRLFVLALRPRVMLCNPGGPFGSTFSLASSIFLLGAAGLLLFFGVQWWQEYRSLSVWAWAFLFAGGLSNFLERIFFGCVTDYVRVGMLPVFNLADVLLTMGVCGVCVSWWQEKKDIKN